MPTTANDIAAPQPKNHAKLVVADLVLVAAILLIHFFTPATEATTLAAYIGVAIAGLFVVIPLLVENLRRPAVGAVALGHFAQNIAESNRILQDDLRVLGETVLKRLNSVEKQIHANVANPANFPALGEIADKIADLATLTAEDGDLARLRTTLEEIQAQLEQLADTVRALEVTAKERPLAADGTNTAEPDGELPPSLMAKAFSATTPATGAVARLINKAAGGAENPALQQTNPSEDDVWQSASDMADDEADAPDATPSLPSLFPKTTPESRDEKQISLALAQPDMLGELGLPPPDEKPLRTSKGATVLIVNAAIGMGNKPYVRGIGTGLHTDIGEPMEQIAAGRWRWISPDGTSPLKITVWKNDIVRATSGKIELVEGSTVEANPIFPSE